MNLVQFKRHDADGDIIFIRPTSRWSNRAPSSETATAPDVVVAAQAGLALVRVSGPIKKPAGRTAG